MNRAIKKLYKHNHKSLKALHDTFGIDYNAPYQAKVITGNTTIKKILASIEYSTKTLIIVLTNNPDSYYKDKYLAATITAVESVYIGERDNRYNHYSFNFNSGIDNYYTKSDFREAIKTYNATTIIIAQDIEYLKKTKKPEIDYYDRYKIDQKRTWSRALISLTTGISIDQYQHDTKNIDALDKSGYIIDHYRCVLKHKARELKAKREKAAYLATDNSQRMSELNIRIQAKKLELIERLKAANTSESFEAVCKAIGESWSHGLSNAARSYERMEQAIREQTFSSIDDFNTRYNAISEQLMAI